MVALCADKADDSSPYDDAKLLDYLVDERVFSNLPFPLCRLLRTKGEEPHNRSLNECLFHLSNLLLELESKDQHFGVIRALAGLIRSCDPVTHRSSWNELNLLEVTLSLTTKLYSTGSDILCQTELIPICTQLLVGRCADDKSNQLIQPLCDHNMKILSIYHTVLQGRRPVFIPKGHKNDIFTNSKEVLLLNSRGYFGNDYFYLKIYKTVKVLSESYKINVDNEIDSKFLTLLKVTLASTADILEVLNTGDDVTSQIKLVEEVLLYLPAFLHFATVETIECVRRLLRYSFSWNFASRREKYEEFMLANATADDTLKKLRQFDVCDQPNASMASYSTVTSSPRTGQKILNALVQSKSAEESPVHGSQGMIKLFESTVIQSLRLFTKSDATVQATILKLICQVIALNVDYSLLDAKNLFMEFILKLLELIETGTVK